MKNLWHFLGWGILWHMPHVYDAHGNVFHSGFAKFLTLLCILTFKILTPVDRVNFSNYIQQISTEGSSESLFFRIRCVFHVFSCLFHAKWFFFSNIILWHFCDSKSKFSLRCCTCKYMWVICRVLRQLQHNSKWKWSREKILPSNLCWMNRHLHSFWVNHEVE